MSNSQRNHGVDALRTAAILGMMAAHTTRLITFDSRPEWSRLILLLEPLIPSLFLFLVGLSLVYSFAKTANPKTWYLRQARRAGILWFISALFSAFEYGIRLPDVLVASGILCTISYSILSVGAVLLVPRAKWILSLLLCLGTLDFFLLDRAGMRPFLLVSGNSPLLPLWLFTISGALTGLIIRRTPKALLLIGIPALFFIIWAMKQFGWEALFNYPLGRSDVARLLAAPIIGGDAKVVGYYSLRPLLSLFCLSVILLALGVFSFGFSWLKEKWARRFFALGRHSLEAYVLHLALLAVLVVSFGLHPLKTAWQGNVVLTVVALICAVWAFFREKYPQKLKFLRF